MTQCFDFEPCGCWLELGYLYCLSLVFCDVILARLGYLFAVSQVPHMIVIDQRYIYRFFHFRIRKTAPTYKMLPVRSGHLIERVSGPLVCQSVCFVYARTTMVIQIVGYLLHWGLFGTLSIQLYLYYLAFPKDRQFVKCLVYGIYIVEFVQTILVAHDAFAVFGYGFGDLEALTEMHFNWLILPIMIAIDSLVGQVFYAYRIFILSRSRIVPAFVICVSLASFVTAIITGIRIFQAGDVTKLNDRETSISGGISCAGYALCDIIIALCMTYYLMRSKTGFRSTQILVTKIIRLTIETGSVTAIVALVTIILFLAFPHQDFYVTPALATSKLYANTIYMVLNSRIRIMGGRDTYTSSTDMEITSTMMRDITSHSTHGTQRTPVDAITAEVFTSGNEMGRISEKLQDGDTSFLT
ncbi:hypothetical protein EDD18DRAFT_1261670 [Armillaria luteobubalina]|uniref:DUF6534 domain-containing protein n=1 Tax=Armillaria luteobubalina TaxID=153913 RepID=A0AA39PF47_9AGAR|nr:hypothetical protein EDD18DRAFT_1261670 [Armillaria luteobubalina]